MSSGAVIPYLCNGIGNRLFILATAKHLAEMWNVPLVLFRSAIKAEHGRLEDMLALFPELPVPLDEDPPSNIKMIGQSPDEVFESVSFPFEAPDHPTGLGGCFQAASHFKGDTLVPSWEPVLKDRCTEIADTVPVGAWFIHFRFGDYKSLDHYRVNLRIYRLKCVLEIPKEAHLRIFSDEPELCTDFVEEVADMRPDIKVSWSVAKTDVEALYEMSLCTGGAITANSTFSWWGAYFAHQRGGASHRAFYPDNWGQGLPKPTHIVPDWGVLVTVSS